MPTTNDAARILITVGLGICLIGVGLLLWPGVFGKLGRLPGDVAIRRDGAAFYFPIVTCLALSALLTLVMWIIRWRGR
jgi:hypothetical protein